MKKPSPWYKCLLTGLLITAAWNVAAQPAVDASASFAPPLTETSVIYAAFSINDNNGNGSADAVLALSEGPVADWGDYSAALRFNTDIGALDVRNRGDFSHLSASALPTTFETMYRVWLQIDLANQSYSAYAQTDAMAAPVLIFADAGFRKQGVSELRYWSALHNAQGDADPLVLEAVTPVAEVGDYPPDLDTSDEDGDGIPAFKDNCPDTYNPLQTDVNGNGVGDVCDPELDASLNLAISLPGGSNGANSHVALPPFNHNSLPITIEMWYQPDPVQNYYATLWYNRGSTNNSGVQYDRWTNTNNIKGVWNGHAEVPESGPIPGQWNHVALVVSSDSKILYLNGEAFQESGSQFESFAFDGSTFLGWDNVLPDRTLKGLIDEVRVWTTARSAEEIRGHMLTPLSGNEEGLLAYYDFNTPQPTVLDLSSNGFDGTLVGGTYVRSSVFDAMEIKQSTAVHSNKVVNSETDNNPVLQLTLAAEHQQKPLQLEQIQLSFDAETPLNILTNIRLFAGNELGEFHPDQPLAQWEANLTTNSLTLDLEHPIQMGNNHFWITVGINEQASKNDQIRLSCEQISVSDGSAIQLLVPEDSTPDARLTINPDAFIAYTKMPLSIVTPSAATSVEGANFASFQQNAITTYKGYQYVTYWNNRGRVCISRRQLPHGEWQEIEFSDHTISLSRTTDNHYTISMGIAPGDGTIHLSYDHHNDPLRYKRSVKDLANDPENIPWSAASFNSKQNHLVAGTPVENVTYPRFIAKPNGDLLFECRIGWSGDGDSFLWEYDTNNGSWTYIGEYLNGTSVNENAYINGLHYDPSGKLHVSWVWRQTPDARTNHDIYYAFSDDDGRTWYNADGEQVGTAHLAPMTIHSPGLKVWTVGTNRGLINQEAQTVDSKGGIHILQTYIGDEQPNSNDFWGGRISHGQLRHIYRDENGVWQNQVIAPSGRNRNEIAVDAADNLYVVAGNYRIYFAAAADKWQTWTELDLSDHNLGMNEPLIDREALLHHSILSFVMAHGANDGRIIVPTYLLQPNGTDTALPKVSPQKELEIYPNPFQESLRVNLSSVFSYAIYDLSGRLMESMGSGQHQQLGQSLPQGLFLLEITYDQKTSRHKIIKRP